MSSTLSARITPRYCNDYVIASCSLKGIFARKFYDHDGSLNGKLLTLGDEYLSWIEGLLSGLKLGGNSEKCDKEFLQFLIDNIIENDSVDIWID